MSDETTSKSGKALVYVVACLASVFVIYALSIGPAYVLAERNVLPGEFLTGYEMLTQFAIATGTAGTFRAYISVWFTLTGTPMP